MLLRHLLINRYLEEAHQRPQLHMLLEDASTMLKAAIKQAEGDKFQRIDLEQLADIITTLKLLTNADYRAAMTRDDVGIDPNNANELFDMLDRIPNDPSRDLTKTTRDFVRSVALMSKSMRSKELDELKKIAKGDAVARKDLAAFSTKITQALDRLRDRVKK